MTEAFRWIDRVLASQEPDGWFGPRTLKTSLKGKPDLWPHLVMLNVLQSFHEFSGDDRVLPCFVSAITASHIFPVSLVSPHGTSDETRELQQQRLSARL